MAPDPQVNAKKVMTQGKIGMRLYLLYSSQLEMPRKKLLVSVLLVFGHKMREKCARMKTYYTHRKTVERSFQDEVLVLLPTCHVNMLHVFHRGKAEDEKSSEAVVGVSTLSGVLTEVDNDLVTPCEEQQSGRLFISEWLFNIDSKLSYFPIDQKMDVI